MSCRRSQPRLLNTCSQLSLRFTRASIGPKLGGSFGDNNIASDGGDGGSVSVAADGGGDGGSVSVAADGGGTSVAACVSSHSGSGHGGCGDRGSGGGHVGDGASDSKNSGGSGGGDSNDSAASSGTGAVSHWSCDLLVGADGIFSNVRQQLVGTHRVPRG